LTLIIPVFNEADGFAERWASLRAYLDEAHVGEYEVVFVDDGSTDASALVLAAAAASRENVRVVRHDRNRGLDAAIRSGIAASRGSIVVTYDADLTYARATIATLVETLRRTDAHVVLASPYMRGGSSIGVPRVRRTLSVWANRLLSFAVRGRFATLTCMVRAYDGAYARRLFLAHPDAETTFDILLRAYNSNATILEVPATLDWSRQPAERARRLKVRKMLHHTTDVLRCAFRTRPSIVLTVPGLFPGLLPAAVALAALLHADAWGIARVAAATTVVQYLSLAYFSFQLGDHALTLRRKRCSSQATKTRPAVVSEVPNSTRSRKFSTPAR
jgi:glycosyltransferase involved in cell wall biosynthesis